MGSEERRECCGSQPRESRLTVQTHIFNNSDSKESYITIFTARRSLAYPSVPGRPVVDYSDSNHEDET